jgi:hypothetical protein
VLEAQQAAARDGDLDHGVHYTGDGALENG